MINNFCSTSTLVPCSNFMDPCHKVQSSSPGHPEEPTIMKRLSSTSSVKMLNKAYHPWVKHVTHDMGSLSSGIPIFISHWPVSTPQLLLPKAQSVYYIILFPYLSHEAAPKPLFIQPTETRISLKSLLCQLIHREQIVISWPLIPTGSSGDSKICL